MPNKPGRPRVQSKGKMTVYGHYTNGPASPVRRLNSDGYEVTPSFVSAAGKGPRRASIKAKVEKRFSDR